MEARRTRPARSTRPSRQPRSAEPGREPARARRERHGDRRTAPVIKRRGQSSVGRWRFACPTFLRQSFVEWAALTIPNSLWASAYYQQQKARGKSHQTALRALAFKWIRIMYRCWERKKPYDEVQYLKALQKSGSPLLQIIANQP